jgi:TolA-binding protein
MALSEEKDRMSNRLTRKEIKENVRHDEFQTAVTSTVDSLASHRQLAMWVAIGLLVTVSAVSAGLAWKRSSAQAASTALAKATEIYDAPIDAEGAKPDDPKSPSFASDTERLAQAKEALAAVSGGVAGDIAELYLAKIALSEGDTDSARAAWEKFLKNHSDDVLAISVRRNLIRLDRDQDKGEALVLELESELASESKSLPEDLLLFELAETLDKLERDDEAGIYYKRIVDDYPQSSFAAVARQKTST